MMSAFSDMAGGVRVFGGRPGGKGKEEEPLRGAMPLHARVGLENRSRCHLNRPPTLNPQDARGDLPL